MSDQIASWVAVFAGLDRANDPNCRRALDGAREVTLPAGTPVFSQGETPGHYMLVLEGSVRVQKISESGREIVLYRVESGQSCVLTTTCLLGGEVYPADAVAETDVRAVVIPSVTFRKSLADSPGFRDFVFSTMGQRVSNLVMLVEEVAFGRMDCRLAHWLLERAGADNEISVTHHAIASELGTAREVVSRLLKEFERIGSISLRRGHIHIESREPLQTLIEQSPR